MGGPSSPFTKGVARAGRTGRVVCVVVAPRCDRDKRQQPPSPRIYPPNYQKNNSAQVQWMADHGSLVEAFAAQCTRARSIVDVSVNALGAQHSLQQSRDAERLNDLKAEISRLAAAVGGLDDEVQPQLARLARYAPQHAPLPRWPQAVISAAAPTSTEVNASSRLQAAWRRRQPRVAFQQLHCRASSMPEPLVSTPRVRDPLAQPPAASHPSCALCSARVASQLSPGHRHNTARGKASSHRGCAAGRCHTATAAVGAC